MRGARGLESGLALKGLRTDRRRTLQTLLFAPVNNGNGLFILLCGGHVTLIVAMGCVGEAQTGKGSKYS